MKVAFFVDDFPSSTQTFVLSQIAGAIENDCTVSIFAHRMKAAQNTHRLFNKHQMGNRTTYLPKVPQSFLKRAGTLISYFTQGCHGSHIKTLTGTLNVLRYGRQSASLKLACNCLPYLNNGSFDILHCQFGMLGEAVTTLRQTGALAGKIITAFRGYDTKPYLRKNPRGYENLFKYGDLFLPVCDHFKKWLIANGCPDKKIVVLRSGIELKNFKFCARKPPKDQPVKILSVGRLVEKKGFRFGLEAVAKIIHSGKKIKYVIFGEGPLRKDLEKLTAELGIGDSISMPGEKTHSDVIKEMESSHILLAPSITAASGDQEGIPNVLKEAMAYGMPVISTWHSGIPELVVHRKSGFLVREKDADGIRDSLLTLLNYPDLWPQMGKAGRSIIEKDYDIEVLNSRLLALYRELCNRTGGGQTNFEWKN